MKENNNIKIEDAISRIRNIITRFDKNSQTNLMLAINALEYSGAKYLQVSDRMERLLDNESRLNEVSDKWAEDVYIAALGMKRHLDCKQYYEHNKKVIDGEIQSMWISIISAILGIFTTIVVGLLMLFNIIDNINIDGLAYVIALVGWLVTIIVAAIAKIINKHQIKKHNNNSEYTVDELMAVKYEDSSKMVRALLPSEVKRPLIHVARDLNIGKLDFIVKAPVDKAFDMDMVVDRDMNIGEVKL